MFENYNNNTNQGDENNHEEYEKYFKCLFTVYFVVFFEFFSILILFLFTEIIYDCSVKLNVMLLYNIFLIMISPLLIQYISNKKNRKIFYWISIIIFYILLFILFYRRNRIYRVIINDYSELQDSDYALLYRLFKKPSSVILIFGKNVLKAINTLESKYDFVKDYLLDNPSDSKILELKQSVITNSRYHISGNIYRGSFAISRTPEIGEISNTNYLTLPAGQNYKPSWFDF